VIPFVIACGTCFFCDRNLFSACETTNDSIGMNPAEQIHLLSTLDLALSAFELAQPLRLEVTQGLQYAQCLGSVTARSVLAFTDWY